MPYYDSEAIERARQVDLLTYLQTCEPQELVHVSGNVYCTKTHDSLRISNGKWCWFSRGIGGYSALDYLMEDYLEAVLMMQKRHGYVRCVDVAEHLGVKKPSVSRAVKELSKSGHLVKNADGTLSLTELGLQFAEQIYEKHQFFTRQLIEAGVPQDIAAQDACKLEHVISETSYKKLREAAWPSSREVIPSDE